MSQPKLDNLTGGSQATTRAGVLRRTPLLVLSQRLAFSKWYVKLAVLAACLALPALVHSNYAMRVIIYIYLYIVLALGLNVVMGFAGLLNIGHAAFYALGAYTTAILTTFHGISFWLTVPIGMALGVACGLLIGFPTFSLRDDYLAMVTLGFGQIVYIVANYWMALTRGPQEIPAIPAPRIGCRRLAVRDRQLYEFLLSDSFLCGAHDYGVRAGEGFQGRPCVDGHQGG